MSIMSLLYDQDVVDKMREYETKQEAREEGREEGQNNAMNYFEKVLKKAKLDTKKYKEIMESLSKMK